MKKKDLSCSPIKEKRKCLSIWNMRNTEDKDRLLRDKYYLWADGAYWKQCSDSGFNITVVKFFV